MTRYVVLALVVSSVAAYPMVPEQMETDTVLTEESSSMGTPAEDILSDSTEYNQQKNRLASAFQAEVAGAQAAIDEAKHRNSQQLAAVEAHLKSATSLVDHNRNTWSAGNRTERQDAVDAAQLSAADAKTEADIYATRASDAAEDYFQSQSETLSSGDDIDAARLNRTAYQQRQQDNATHVHQQVDHHLTSQEAHIRSHYEAVQNRITEYAHDTIESLELNATDATTALNNALDEEIHEIKHRLSSDQTAYQTAAAEARQDSVHAMNSDFERLRTDINSDVDHVSRSSEDLITGDATDSFDNATIGVEN